MEQTASEQEEDKEEEDDDHNPGITAGHMDNWFDHVEVIWTIKSKLVF